MRNFGVLSVLMFSVSATSVLAGNYVAQQSYNSPGVVVNMDVIANQGYGSAPALQQPLQAPSLQAPSQFAPLPPLRPPVLQRSISPNMVPPSTMPPVANAPAYPSYYTSRPEPLALQAPMPIPPAPVQQAYMPPQHEQPMDITQPAPMPASPAPVAMMAPPEQPIPAPPIMDAPEFVPPAPPIADASPNVEPQPFSTREMAASAGPIVNMDAPSPISENPDPIMPPAPIAVPAHEASADAKKPAIISPGKDGIVPKDHYIEKANNDPNGVVTPDADKTASVPAEEKPVRELLAQAREEAGAGKHEERNVVLFDNPPTAPSAESPLKESDAKSTPVSPVMKTPEAKTADILKPAPLPMPSDDLKEPSVPEPKVAEAAPVSKLLPTPITQTEAASAPMPITPVVDNAPVADQKVAMLKPAALPDVAPASIPVNSAAVKKAETVVDDFEAYRLLFDKSSAELKPTEREVLDNIIGKLKRDENIKLQLRAYAASTPDNTAQARRLSLSRALAVRGYLLQQGISSSRLDVRALGMGSAAMGDVATRADIPGDRVDMIFTR